MPKRTCLIGRRFGRAIGTEFIAMNANLAFGTTRSCGCLMRDRASEANRTHGHTIGGRSRTYRAWIDMLKRCRKPTGHDIETYKGITVCPQWKTSFETFLADMGECPTGLTIDRWPNNKGNYEPDNCRWATPLQQQRNKTNNRVFTVRGITGCLSELAVHFGIYRKTVAQRIKLGWSIEDAFTLIGQRKSRRCYSR